MAWHFELGARDSKCRDYLGPAHKTFEQPSEDMSLYTYTYIYIYIIIYKARTPENPEKKKKREWSFWSGAFGLG